MAGSPPDGWISGGDVARTLTIICMFGCGHKIVGTMYSDDLDELMQEHYRLVHRRELDDLMKAVE